MKRVFVVAVGGIQGVGKSTIVPRLPNYLPSVEIVPTSRVLADHASQHGYGDFHALPVEEKAQVREAVGSLLLQRIEASPNDIFVLDWHYMDIREGVLSIQPDSLVGRVDAFIILEASPETVLTRRVNDPTRTRDLDLNQIRAERDGQLMIARGLASRQGRPLFRVPNEGSPDKVVVALAQAILLLMQGSTLQERPYNDD